MAKPNSITSATNSDCNASSSSVSSGASTARAGISRRKAMTMMSTVAAVPALAFAGPAPAFAGRAHRSAWDRTLAAYRREQTAYAAVAAEYEAACRAYEAVQPEDRRAEFEPYGLHPMMRDEPRTLLIRTAEIRIIMRDHALILADKADCAERLSPEQLGAVRTEAARVVDDFMAWNAERQRVHDAEWASFEPFENAHDEASRTIWDARNALLNTPAPDVQAMLLKLDILAEDMGVAEVEDAARVILLRDDARRLLTVS